MNSLSLPSRPQRLAGTANMLVSTCLLLVAERSSREQSRRATANGSSKIIFMSGKIIKLLAGRIPIQDQLSAGRQLIFVLDFKTTIWQLRGATKETGARWPPSR